MSVKAISLVWEFPCPSDINGKEFKPGHKYVLVAYADHADHSGRNIYPAVETIAKKTGYDARSVQRLTRELEEMNLLVLDGSGPRGTKRFHIPFNDGGDKISPLTKYQGDKSQKSLGDIPSGDIPSGDKMSPELKNINPINLYISTSVKDIWGDTKKRLSDELPKAMFDTWLADTETAGITDQVMVVICRNAYAISWLDRNVKETAQRISGYFIIFATAEDIEIDRPE